MIYKPDLNSEDALFVLTNLEAFILHFENKGNIKITEGVRKIIEEILLESIKPKDLN